MGWGFTTLALLDNARLVGQARVIEATPLQLRWLENTKEHAKSWDLRNAAVTASASAPVPWETPAQAVTTQEPPELAGGGSAVPCPPRYSPRLGTATSGTPGYQARALTDKVKILHKEKGQPFSSCCEGRQQKY